MSDAKGWIGVDLDKTLAHYDTWRGADHVGAPIAPMVERVKRWLAEGREVYILTARVASTHDEREVWAARVAIGRWCREHIGRVLPVTAEKDGHMLELWDDRAVAVEANTGRQLSQSSLFNACLACGERMVAHQICHCENDE